MAKQLTEQELDDQASAVNDIIQRSTDLQQTVAYLNKHVSPAVLVAVADLNHVEVEPTQRKGSIIKAILDAL